jgi:hypothetical protein
MPRGRPWKRVKIAVEDLSHEILGQGQDVLVGGELSAPSRAHEIQINTRHVV